MGRCNGRALFHSMEQYSLVVRALVSMENKWLKFSLRKLRTRRFGFVTFLIGEKG